MRIPRMLRLLCPLAAVAALCVPTPGRAAVIEFDGELFVRIGSTIQPATLSGGGAASVSFSAGGAIDNLTIPAGFLSARTFLAVPNAFPIIQVVLTGPSGGSPGGGNPLQNQTIMLTRGGTCDRGHLQAYPVTTMGHVPKRGVLCPGGGLAGFGGLDGSAFVGIFFAIGSAHSSGSGTSIMTRVHTPASSTILSSGVTRTVATNMGGTTMVRTFLPNHALPVANLSVPLAVVGSGSILVTPPTTVMQGIRVTVTGAGWTTGTARIYNATADRMSHLAYAVHLALSATRMASESVVSGTGTTETLMGGVTGSTAMGNLQIQLVSPVQVLNNATNAYSNTLVSLTLRQAPEPAELLLLGLGAAVFALYGVWRMRHP